MDISILTIDGIDIPHTQRKDLEHGEPFYMERVSGDKWDIFTNGITLPANIYDRLKDLLYLELTFQTSTAEGTTFRTYRGFTEYCAATSVERDRDNIHLRYARFRITPYIGRK